MEEYESPQDYYDIAEAEKSKTSIGNGLIL